MLRPDGSGAISRSRDELAASPRPSIPYARHSGARQRREPGIHKPRLWLWIPGPALARRPGMTTVGCDRFHGIDGLVTATAKAPDQKADGERDGGGRIGALLD